MHWYERRPLLVMALRVIIGVAAGFPLFSTVDQDWQSPAKRIVAAVAIGVLAGWCAMYAIVWFTEGREAARRRSIWDL